MRFDSAVSLVVVVVAVSHRALIGRRAWIGSLLKLGRNNRLVGDVRNCGAMGRLAGSEAGGSGKGLPVRSA